MPKTMPPSKAPKVATKASGDSVHVHRTAKVVELVASSSKSFEKAIKNGIADAAATTRGITGAEVEGMSMRCDNGKILEYKVNLKIAFGIERTKAP